MPTILDSFIVEFGLDAKRLNKGLKEVDGALKKAAASADKMHMDVGEGAKQMAAGYKKLYDGILAVGAAMVAAVAGKEMVEYLTKQDSAMARTSKFLNISTQDLQNWEGAAVQAGDTAGGMEAAFQHVSGEMQKMALTGTSDMIPFLVQAHVDLTKFFNAATSLPEKLKLIQDAMRNMDPARAKSLLEGMGLGGAANALTTQRDAFEGLLEAQQKLNAHSKEDDEAAIRRAQAWQRVEAALEGVGRTIVTFLSPAIEGILNFIATYAPASISLLTGIGVALAAVSTLQFSAILGNLAKLGGAFESAAAAAALLLNVAKGLGVVGAGLGGYAVGSFIESKTGVGSKLGGWLFDLLDRNDYTSANPSARAKGRAGGASTLPRGIRNNNPGNLEFAGQAGATRENGGGGRFAAFGSMAEGVAALAAQLQRYSGRGNDTVAGIIGKYAPPGENNTGGYIASIAKKLGVDPNAHLNLNNLNVLREMMSGISVVENGPGRLGMDQLNAGIDLYRQRGTGGSRASAGGATTTVTTGDVHIHTTASTMTGAGKDLGASLRRHMATQSNTGIE